MRCQRNSLHQHVLAWQGEHEALKGKGKPKEREREITNSSGLREICGKAWDENILSWVLPLNQTCRLARAVFALICACANHESQI